MSSDEEIDGAEDGDFEDDGDFEMDEVEEEDDEGTGAVDDLDGDEDASREAEDVSHFSKPSVKDPRSNTERGEAVRTQLALWDGLLETRIKIQKPLSVCNTLPHPTNSALFVDRIDEASRKQIDDVLHELRGLLAELGELHSVFLKGNYTVLRSSSRRDSDEEIESDTEDDEAEDKDGADTSSMNKFANKSMDLEEMERLLEENYRSMEPFRNSTLETWNSRTQQFAVGTKKGFSSFEQAPVKQISQVMSDKGRLIERTQIPRTTYRILGSTMNVSADSIAAENENKTEKPSEPKVNPEIFDDDDFYHTLLRELIERKSGDTTDPIELSRQQIQLGHLRKRTKKVVDPKAKGDRKLKFDPHPKLISFMAPQRVCSITEQARDDIFKSLFGKLQRGPATVEGVGNGLVGLRLVR
ncbi:hypothetical protein RvY_14540-1 [Ramazzottius varieornatus]|uniref:Protein AATF n=1 Tax=Ramazzottius varieornatus TaxID=947166 RepID=A0A1D1W043_RAMVA|nr:hypothetical protein RvY_14540-1 [Ramazzottius varieornatus]